MATAAPACTEAPREVTKNKGTLKRKLCKVVGCEKRAKALEFCSTHYTRNRLGIPLDGPLRGYRFNGVCGVEGCGRKHASLGYCSTHYDRFKKGLDLEAPIKPKAKNGSGTVSVKGYRYVYREGINVLEHRVVMEEVLGRGLLTNENVHHINGNKSDNRPENLELWIESQPPGQRVEDLVNWAKEILERYGL